METQITTIHGSVHSAIQQPNTTLAAFSIGPAVDLAELDTQFRAWLKTPWRSDEIVRPVQAP
jgi:hypothetical protein